LAEKYLALWNEPDADRRRRMIAELWREDGRHFLQPPQEIRGIAAQPGIGLTAILEARGHEEIEARAASAHGHWVGSEGLSFRRRDDAERLGDVVKFHWEAVAQDGEVFGVGLNFHASPRTAGSSATTRSSSLRGMGAALLGEQEGSVGDDRLDACLRVDASVSPTSCRCPHRTKCWSLAGRGHAPAIRLEARAWSETTPGHDLSARGNVAKVDNSGWSLYGAQRSQPVATGSKRDGAENGSLKRKPLPSVATSCPTRSMVRRGSTVRVRQRAYLKCLQIDTLLLSVARTRGHIPDTSAVRATHGDVSRRLPTRLSQGWSTR
ncbi:MAG: hypothetical protein JXP37_01580, partial [Coriobacteriia bacterium]|nr:hypothetical protein [Coriobacteriia bacterium]